MSAAAARVIETEAPVNEKRDDVLIHVRFMPSGAVFTIDGVPETMKADAWHKALQIAASQYYQALAGGRGFYRIPRATYTSILEAQASA